MWIRSQNGTFLVNAQAIWTSSSHGKCLINAGTGEHEEGSYVVAEYSNEKSAIEILDKIEASIGIGGRHYRMPPF